MSGDISLQTPAYFIDGKDGTILLNQNHNLELELAGEKNMKACASAKSCSNEKEVKVEGHLIDSLISSFG